MHTTLTRSGLGYVTEQKGWQESRHAVFQIVYYLSRFSRSICMATSLTM